MQKLLLLAFICLAATSPVLFAQKQETVFRAKIWLDDKNMSDLARLGIETDHGLYEAGRWFQSDFTASELKRVRAAGFRADTLISDVASWYLRENAGRKPQRTYKSEARGFSPCEGFLTDIPTPDNYTFGTMGGYYTYDEYLAVLDDMHAKFPHLISARQKLHPDLVTHEGRPLWYVRISDNPDSDEAELEALFTAVHHAREPNSLSHLIFYMWHLLENYGSDADLRYLIDNSEQYFAPCLNPDGYIYNETTNPFGGGYWRKNRRDNGNGSFGVDLNRNYGHEWGHDDIGSSPESEWDTYRGPQPFSEPETQMVREFSLLHSFRIAMNCHTFSRVLVHPWGFEDGVPTPDLTTVANWLNRENNYYAGSCKQVLNYFANGGSDDWWYAARNTLAYTPETGPTFWPLIDEIDGLNKEMYVMNLSAAWYALGGIVIRSRANDDVKTLSFQLPYQIRRYKLGTGQVSVDFQPLTNNVQAIAPQNAFSMSNFDEANFNAAVTLKSTVQAGDPIKIVLKVTLDGLTRTDTFSTRYGGSYTALLDEDGEGNLGGFWQTTGWASTTEAFVSPSRCITDSPNDTYNIGDNTLTQIAPLDIPANASQVRLRFWAKWDIEQFLDFAQVQISEDGSNFVPLNGVHTHLDELTPTPNEPVYDGQQPDWVEECIDLQAYVGKSVFLRFLLHGDAGLPFDGFYFDDLRLEYAVDDALQAQELFPGDFYVLQNSPNPANGRTVISWKNLKPSTGNVSLQIFNANNQLVRQLALPGGDHASIEIGTSDLAPGLYFYRLSDGTRYSVFRKLLVN